MTGAERFLGAGTMLVDFSQRTQISLRGADRAGFLHNFCTNDVRRLAPGAGCEAFVLNAQGKILGHVLVFCGTHDLVLETVPDQSGALLAHLDRYLIREQVTLEALLPERAEWLLAGDDAPRVLAALGVRELPPLPVSQLETLIGTYEVRLRRMPLVSCPAVLVDCQRGEFAPVGALLAGAGATQAGLEAWNAARIEAGWPEYGVDISDKNLPQEVNRDGQAISFTKGCYLGQETVARIDALGHVNKMLVGVRFGGATVPGAGTELRDAEQVIGQVTSACFSPMLGSPLALAYVRRGHTTAGTKMAAPDGPAEIVGLPVGVPGT